MFHAGLQRRALEGERRVEDVTKKPAIGKQDVPKMIAIWKVYSLIGKLCQLTPRNEVVNGWVIDGNRSHSNPSHCGDEGDSVDHSQSQTALGQWTARMRNWEAQTG